MEAHRACVGKREADIIKAIVLLSNGWSIQQVAEALLLDERTILRYKQSYFKKGIDGLIESNYHGGCFKLTVAHIDELKKALDNHLFGSAAVKKNFKITYTPEGMVQTLHLLGYSYKKTKIEPGKADREQQKKFVKRYSRIKKSLENTEKIYFLDAVHPTHKMMPAYAWIRQGEERGVNSNSGRKRINVIGFYSPNDQEIIAASYEKINAAATIQMFAKIEKKHPELTRIIVFMDNARYNYCREVWQYLRTSRIQIVYLTSYSPNLNLIERLWKLLKKRVMDNTYYEKFDDFQNKIMSFFKTRNRCFKKELQTLLAENFHIAHCPDG